MFDEVKVPEEAPGGGGSIAIPGSNMGAVEVTIKLPGLHILS